MLPSTTTSGATETVDFRSTLDHLKIDIELAFKLDSPDLEKRLLEAAERMDIDTLLQIVGPQETSNSSRTMLHAVAAFESSWLTDTFLTHRPTHYCIVNAQGLARKTVLHVAAANNNDTVI